MKILHIASFNGNIGDLANHSGFQVLRDKYLSSQFNITNIEMRRIFFKQYNLNSANFIKAANNSDLVVFGGGGYFELWVENSATGTSIDISIQTLNKINKPIIFYSLGLDLGQGYSEKSKTKFKAFLDYISMRDNIILSLRNDGSLKNLNRLYQDRFIKNTIIIPDGGFFCITDSLIHHELSATKINFLINLAGDMSDVRFSKKNSSFSRTEFLKGLAMTLLRLEANYSNNIRFIFVPHIYKDLIIINDFLAYFDDLFIRENFVVAPLITDFSGYNKIFDLYSKADFIIANRFHSNIAAIRFRKKFIGVANYQQIRDLFEETKLDNLVDLNELNLFDKMYNMIISIYNNDNEIMNNINNLMIKLDKDVESSYLVLENLIKNIK